MKVNFRILEKGALMKAGCFAITISAALKRFGILALLLSATVGCELSPSEQAAVDQILNGGVSLPTTAELEPVAPACFEEEFVQPEAVVSKSVDLLFVLDTSGSLQEERGRVAEGLDAFVSELPPDVDYRIGVMLAHGSKSKHSGRLFANKGKPLVLDSQTMSLYEIKKQLRTSMLYPVSDWYSDGGEEGLYSLSRAFDADRIAENRAHGFFRKDAALAVVFVADENDICADYPAGIKPVYDPDKLEAPARARDCAGISVSSVYEKLRAYQEERPFLVGGVVYNNAKTMPRYGENELAYGLLELIRMAGGASLDIAGSHYNEGLAEIGSLVTIKLTLIHDFKLSRTGIDDDTLEVFVDGRETSFSYHQENSLVNLSSPGSARSQVSVRYCLLSGEDEASPELPRDDTDPNGDDDRGGKPECTGLRCYGGVIGV